MLIKRIPWRTLVIVLICAVVFMPIGAWLQWLGTERTLNNTTISKAINKPTQSTSISNTVELGKKTKGDNIDINMIPNNNQSPTQIIVNDTCININDFSPREQRKIRKWREKIKKP